MEGLGVIQKDFWRGRRVFLSGHTGFKGAWLALWLEQLGALVTGFSIDIPTEPSLFSLLSPWQRLVDRRGDIRDLKNLTHEVQQAKPEIVFHLAAQSLVRASYADPVATYETNVMGTVNILQAARGAQSIKAIINVTSDKCYENRETQTPYSEEEPFGGKDPYSSSKGCAELVTAAYRSSFFSRARVGLATARAGNVIGGGDWSADRLVPDCIRAFVRDEAVVIRNPLSVRPWQHVLDAVRGYLILAQHLYREPTRFSRGYNFGPDTSDTQSVRLVVSTLCSEWGAGARNVEHADEHAELPEAQMLSLDSSRAKDELGWKSLLTLPEALSWTAAWYKSHNQKTLAGGEAFMRDQSIELLTHMIGREARG